MKKKCWQCNFEDFARNMRREVFSGITHWACAWSNRKACLERAGKK